MAATKLETRIARIQRHIGVQGDGRVGPITVSALERELGVSPSSAQWSLEVSRKGLAQLVRFEVSSEAHYERKLQAPYWPGGASGVTVRIGYDLGTHSAKGIATDFAPHVSDAHVKRLQSAAGKRGTSARRLAARLRSDGIRISLDVANKVFQGASLPSYAQKTRQTYPGVHRLPADAQAMLLSLVYNRGTKLSGASRREMRAIAPLVKRKDLAGIADQIVAMKRLWDEDELPGLHRRRDREARLVRNSKRHYDPDEFVRV